MPKLKKKVLIGHCNKAELKEALADKEGWCPDLYKHSMKNIHDVEAKVTIERIK